MFVTNWISTTKIQKISEITNFFRHYFLSRTEVYYTQTYNSNPLIDGVSLDYIEPFVTHFFKTQTFTNYKSAIDAKHPVMTDVNSQIESSAHNVLCVGYNSNTGAAIYMDPELACMYSVNAGYFLQDYNIVLTGIK